MAQKGTSSYGSPGAWAQSASNDGERLEDMMEEAFGSPIAASPSMAPSSVVSKQSTLNSSLLFGSTGDAGDWDLMDLGSTYESHDSSLHGGKGSHAGTSSRRAASSTLSPSQTLLPETESSFRKDAAPISSIFATPHNEGLASSPHVVRSSGSRGSGDGRGSGGGHDGNAERGKARRGGVPADPLSALVSDVWHQEGGGESSAPSQRHDVMGGPGKSMLKRVGFSHLHDHSAQLGGGPGAEDAEDQSEKATQLLHTSSSRPHDPQGSKAKHVKSQAAS
eukprot:CAMPEP_0173407218 /NCGR_PEP_ID=MMETSP1356-20130122/66572_1 /TAXON_ID=77927 ORGANISM="Hemiselmis virescens, Strain PCC157" /NCGR_SAMPLE_ID=MMETSP1356 /ASSEMBLY_ACC=CAM_ASM_000847 /LENGTH=277 /DNA_ID=CAMNT_0014368351 /DNA_START=143 /DNA_END=972 /DNA_ORIENTATION=+